MMRGEAEAPQARLGAKQLDLSVLNLCCKNQPQNVDVKDIKLKR